jgi:hypothetical protein
MLEFQHGQAEASSGTAIKGAVSEFGNSTRQTWAKQSHYCVLEACFEVATVVLLARGRRMVYSKQPESRHVVQAPGPTYVACPHSPATS